MNRVSFAEQFYKEGNYEKAFEIYDALLREDSTHSSRLNMILGKASCQMALYLWQDCFESLFNAFNSQHWCSSFLETFIENLTSTLRRTLGEHDAENEQTCLLDEHLICENCKEIYYYPVTMPCGQTYCRKCCFKNKKYLSAPNVNRRSQKEGNAVNTVLTNIIDKYFPNKVKAMQLRCEGNDFVKEKKYKDALKKYSQALELDPLNYFLLGNLSHVYSAIDEYKTALDYAEKACKIQPNWIKGFYRKGQANVGLKKYPEAAVAYIRVLLVEPENDLARQALYKVLIEILGNIQNGVGGKMISEMAALLYNFDLENNEKDGYKNVLVEEVNSILSKKIEITDVECSLCCRMFYNPITCSCGHTFCQWCLNRCLDHNAVCPVCRCVISNYINIENQNVTKSITAICMKYLGEEFQKRKLQHEEEVEKLANIAFDTGDEVPIFVCTIALPTIPCPLCIFEPRYRLMVRESMESGSRQFGMCCPWDDGSFSDYGVMLEIEEFTLLSDGRSLIKTVGGRRFKVLSRGKKHGYNTAKVEWLKDEIIPEEDIETLKERQQILYDKVIAWFSSLDVITKMRLFNEIGIQHPPVCDSNNIGDRNGPKWIWWSVNVLPVHPVTKVDIISMTDVRQRLNVIEEFFS